MDLCARVNEERGDGEGIDLEFTSITPVHLSSWNPPKVDVLCTALGMLPIYRLELSSWNPPNLETYNSKYIHNSARFLTPSSAQVHPARARAPTTFRTCHQQCTTLATEILSVHNTIVSSCNTTEARKEVYSA